MSTKGYVVRSVTIISSFLGAVIGTTMLTGCVEFAVNTKVHVKTQAPNVRVASWFNFDQPVIQSAEQVNDGSGSKSLSDASLKYAEAEKATSVARAKAELARVKVNHTKVLAKLEQVKIDRLDAEEEKQSKQFATFAGRTN